MEAIEIVKPSKAEEEAIPMVDLFTLEGKTYQVQDRLKPTVSLRYLWMIRTQGPVAADEWLGVTCMGMDAYLAYINCLYMTQEQSDAIWGNLREIVFGEKAPKSETGDQPAKSTSGTPRKRPPSTKTSNGSRTRKGPSKATTRASTASKTAGKTSPPTASGASSDK